MTAPTAPTALGRYLALTERPPLEQLTRTDWRQLPPQVKRYPGRPVPAPAPLAQVLRQAYGLTRYQWHDMHTLPGQTGAHARAAGRVVRPSPSGGGLGSAELYVVDGGGAHHYDAAADALVPVRAGVTPAALGVGRPVAIVLTSVFARLSFKYGEFGFRLQCLDAGALLGQVLALLEDRGLPADPSTGFDDAPVHDLLGIDPDAEVALAVLALDVPGHVPVPAPEDRGAAATPTAGTRPARLLPGMPVVRALRAAGGAASGGVPTDPAAPPAGQPIALPPARPRVAADSGLRRSADGRLCGSLSTRQLGSVLAAARPGPHLRLFAATVNVEGLPTGRYAYDPARHAVLPLPPGGPAVRGRPGEVGGYAAAVYLVGDLGAGHAIGARWYQELQLACGAAAHRATLGALADGVGARIQCSYATADAVRAFALTGTWRPLCQIVIGPDDSRLSYEQPLLADRPEGP